MPRHLWKPAAIEKRGGQRTPRRTFWPKFFWYPLVTLGVLMMVLALRLGVGQTLKGHAWQKGSHGTGLAVYAAAHSPRWDRPLTTLTSDNDDDDDDGDDDGDDCPTTSV